MQASYTEVARGSLNETVVHPREIFKAHSVPGLGVDVILLSEVRKMQKKPMAISELLDPIVTNSHVIILVHSHPSGNVEPSPQDNNMTERIRKAGELLGIKLLDQLIIAPATLQDGQVYYSFAENGCIK